MDHSSPKPSGAATALFASGCVAVPIDLPADTAAGLTTIGRRDRRARLVFQNLPEMAHD